MDLLLRPALFDAYGWFLTWFDTCDACETLDVTCGGTCIDTCDCEFDTLDITCECETWADDTCDCETEGCETLDCPATTDSPDCRTVDDTTCECYPTVGEDTCDGEDPECPTLNETCDEACAAG
ncbi:MAG: hypothetical protein AMJ46_13250 [Latescibacteria bacterium DG_63]|nr:MAG: hypothetical protein AMJ46_13250 [Latescibacteria bacterium DG_63]